MNRDYFEGMPNKNTNQEQLTKFNEEMHKQVDLLRSVFMTENGRLVLQFLIDHTIKQPCWVPTLTNSEKVAYYREGENNVVRTILNIVTTKAPNEPRSATSRIDRNP